MAYDEKLAGRIRQVLDGRGPRVEKKMFGGLCFMVRGNMCCGIVGDELMLRVGAEREAAALSRPHARPMDFTGKPMKGMVYVGKAGIAKKRDLERWVSMALDFVGELPDKKPKPAKKRATASKKKTRPVVPGHFAGFGAETLRFLRGIDRHNDKAWFDAHRDDYEAHYVEAGRAFVSALGPRLQKISKSVSFDPRVNGSLFRIHRDVRFARDKTPYKTHLDLWFWEGEDKGWDTPGFFFRMTPKALILGVGSHRFTKPQLASFREAVLDSRRGKLLTSAIARVRASGDYTIGGKTRSKVPRGIDAAHPRAELLLHEGLTAVLEAPHPPALGSPELVDFCYGHYRKLAPLHRWLLEKSEIF